MDENNPGTSVIDLILPDIFYCNAITLTPLLDRAPVIQIMAWKALNTVSDLANIGATLSVPCITASNTRALSASFSSPHFSIHVQRAALLFLP